MHYIKRKESISQHQMKQEDGENYLPLWHIDLETQNDQTGTQDSPGKLCSSTQQSDILNQCSFPVTVCHKNLIQKMDWMNST